jgi:hypothetical protein
VLDGGHLAITPRSVLDQRLRDAIRQQRSALVRLLSAAVADYDKIYTQEITRAGTADDLVAIDPHAHLNGIWVAEEITELELRCNRLAEAGAQASRYRAAVLLFVARVDELRRWRDGTPAPLASRRLMLDRNCGVIDPVRLDDVTVVSDVSRFVGRLLSAIDYVLAHSNDSADEVLPVYIAQLAKLGVTAHVETIQ